MVASKTLRPYQSELSSQGVDILSRYGLLYLAMQVRTGKTCTAMDICRASMYKSVLFLTKKKAIENILEDYHEFGFSEHFSIEVVNNESMHKIEDYLKFDVVIHDESHRFGSFPKPSSGAKLFKKMFSDKPIIMLSGTPTPESYSQLFHQLWVSDRSPWRGYVNFYRWAKDYVNISQKRIGQFMHNDYSIGIEKKIMSDVDKMMLTYTQEQSGFTSEITESVIHVDMSNTTKSLIDKLMTDRVVNGSSEVILADTAAKLMQKVHQLCSGTIKFESGNSMIIDTSKAEYIRDRFKGYKIAIMYIFKEELTLLRQVLGEETLTNDINEFNTTDKWFVGQVVSSREAISLRSADYLVMYNIQHSAVSYWQSRDRMTTIDRPKNEVFFIFSSGGIEDKIYKVVKSKKKYTTNIFKKDYGIKTN